MTYSGPDRGATVQGGLLSCWSCDRAVSPHALFCHHCGVLQPVRDVDPFVRLGMPAQFDIDQGDLERHFTVFRRHVEPGRFSQRGARERAHAQAHADALAAAFETLRNPVLRARHLLAAAGGPSGCGEPPEMTARRAAVREATETRVLDRLAAVALREVEDCIRDLAAAFRADDLGGARTQMRRLDALEGLADAARARRAELAGGA
jgi:molecular chaperone HscB